MQIVINIDKDDFEEICMQARMVEDIYSRFGRIRKSISHGTPLPKGHGRLIDADAYIDKYEECGWLDDIAVDEFNVITPTIIEADRNEE